MSFAHALRSAITGPSSRRATTASGTARHPISITTASVSLEEQHRVRVRRYVIGMSLRTLAFVLSAVVYGLVGNSWAAMAILVLAVPLPWIAAVLIAAVLIVDDLPPWEQDES